MRGGDKNTKPIPAPPRGAGTKYCPILAPPPLRGGENPCGVGRVKAGRGKIAIPKLVTNLCDAWEQLLNNFQGEKNNVVLFISFLWERIRDIMLRL